MSVSEEQIHQYRKNLHQYLQDLPADKREAVFRMAKKYEDHVEVPEQLDALTDDFFLLAEELDLRPQGGTEHGRVVNIAGLVITVDLVSCIREAVISRRVDVMRTMIRNGVPVATIDRTVLIGACCSRHREMIEVLLETNTFDLSFIDYRAVYELVRADHLEILERLMTPEGEGIPPKLTLTLPRRIDIVRQSAGDPSFRGRALRLLIGNDVEAFRPLYKRLAEAGMRDSLVENFQRAGMGPLPPRRFTDILTD